MAIRNLTVAHYECGGSRCAAAPGTRKNYGQRDLQPQAASMLDFRLPNFDLGDPPRLQIVWRLAIITYSARALRPTLHLSAKTI